MRILKTNNGFVVLLFIYLIIAQSCKVYQNSTASLEHVVNTTDDRFKKIKTNKGKVYHLRRVEIRDGKLYGSKHKIGEMLPQDFIIEDIVSIRAQHKSASTGATIVIIIVAGGAVAFGVFLLTFDLN